MLDLKLGDELLFETPVAFLLQTDLWEMVQHSGPAGMAVLGILICFSVYSWTIIFSKLSALRGAGKANSRFLRAFRKASGMEAVMVASEQFRPSPLVAVFDFGYEELERQVKARGSVTNRTALERTLQLGVSEELAKLERNMNWLATTASVTPFIGLMGTVMGIIRAFQDLGADGLHQPEGRRARHLRSADCHRGRPLRRHPGGDLLQLLRPPDPRTGRAHGRLLARVPQSRGAQLRRRVAMAISTNGGGYRSRQARRRSAIAEINVTPFVDVVLVLLIIFMLTAHVMEFGIEVDVPKVRAVKETAQEMPVVTITKDGVIKLNTDDVNINDLAATIRRKYGKAKGVYVRADKETIWDPIAQVTAELGAAGFQVNMVTQPEDSSPKGRR